MSEKRFIGVDLGGTTTKLAVINETGEILFKWEIPTDVTNDGKNITGNIAVSIERKLQEMGWEKNQILAIGMGAPGPVDSVSGIVYGAVNLGWKAEYPLMKQLEAATSLPVIIDNDANCAALGEMWTGAGNGAKDLVCVTLGTGVGGGVIANGEIVHGISGAAGEIGHITSIPEGGAPCNCGKRGCLETVASATGIARLALEQLKKESNSELAKVYAKKGKISAKDVFESANRNDRAARDVIETAAFYLGLSLANIANTLNPEKIVLAGGVAKAGDLLLQPVKKQFLKFCFPRVADSTEISLASLGNDAGVIGAAWLAKNKVNPNNK